jgi:hypothetical protein
MHYLRPILTAALVFAVAFNDPPAFGAGKGPKPPKPAHNKPGPKVHNHAPKRPKPKSAARKSPNHAAKPAKKAAPKPNHAAHANVKPPERKPAAAKHAAEAKDKPKEPAKDKKHDELAKDKKHEEAAKDKKHEEAAKDKKHEEAAKDKKHEEAAKDKKHEELAKDKKREELAKDKKHEELAKDKKREEAAKDKKHEELAKDKKREEAAKDKKHEELVRDKKREEFTKEKRHEAMTKFIRERDAHVRRFATFNQRTGEYSFDSRSWYSFVVYPGTVGRDESFQADYSTVVPPANITVAPPVIKKGAALPLSREGTALAATLDGLDVEHHWLSAKKVDWKTGNSANDDMEGPASNGGAFVAAVCFRMKVPMPAATAGNLSPGSQHDWLARDGQAKGWLMVADVEAQLLANQGWVVIAAWRNLAAPGERTVSGQTAIVRPSKKAATDIAQQGPRIIDAGLQNHNDIALKDSFPSGPWNNHEVVYFAHRPR